MLASLTLLAAMGSSPATEHREFKGQRQGTQRSPLRGSVRVGANQDRSGSRQEICLALSPFRRWSLETCGTGAGFLAPASPNPDLAHFRLRHDAWRRDLRSGWLVAGWQLGFAELEIGDDDPGFYFGSVGPRALETAGPSLGASLRWTHPLRNHLFVFGELNGNMAYFHHAPALLRPQSPWFPSLSVSIGLGF